MKLFLLAAAFGLASAQIAVTCPINQNCCNGFASLYNDGSHPCKNEGTVAGDKTAEDACVKCMSANIMAIRQLVISGGCTSKSLSEYCSTIPGSSTAPAPVATPVTAPTKKPGPPKPTLVNGPGQTMLNCNQYLVDSCCQWGLDDPTAIGYDPTSQVCKPCLAGAIAKLRKALVNKECSQHDIAFYCDAADWDQQMTRAERAAGFTPYAVPSTCNPMPGNVSPNAPAPTPGPVATSACVGTKPVPCKADTSCQYWAKTKECFDAGTVPCDYMKKADCNKNKPRCEFKKKKCSAKPVIAKCADEPSKKACTKSGFGCFYLKKGYECLSKSMPCSDIDVITDSKGAAIPAKMAQKACKKATGSSCKYNKKLKKCYDPNAAGPVVACSAWATKKDCLKAGCSFRQKVCS